VQCAAHRLGERRPSGIGKEIGNVGGESSTAAATFAAPPPGPRPTRERAVRPTLDHANLAAGSDFRHQPDSQRTNAKAAPGCPARTGPWVSPPSPASQASRQPATGSGGCHGVNRYAQPAPGRAGPRPPAPELQLEQAGPTARSLLRAARASPGYPPPSAAKASARSGPPPRKDSPAHVAANVECRADGPTRPPM